MQLSLLPIIRFFGYCTLKSCYIQFEDIVISHLSEFFFCLPFNIQIQNITYGMYMYVTTPVGTFNESTYTSTVISTNSNPLIIRAVFLHR